MNDYSNDDERMYVWCDGDECQETLELYGEYMECINEIKEEGWHITKNELDESYEHYCPACWHRRQAKGVFE